MILLLCYNENRGRTHASVELVDEFFCYFPLKINSIHPKCQYG